MFRLLADLYSLFFPLVCQSCQRVLTTNEILICLYCRADLPLAKLSEVATNEVERIFYGRTVIEFGTSLLFYEQNGMAQQLIHQLKYKGQEELSALLGQWMGEELRVSKRLPSIDFVVPVPLDRRKMKKRGYNQVDGFGREIARMLNAHFVENNLKSRTSKDTQTKKNRFDRWLNVKNNYYLSDPSVFANSSLLIVDDVITTGATLEACCSALFKSEGVKISIATMAFTS